MSDNRDKESKKSSEKRSINNISEKEKEEKKSNSNEEKKSKSKEESKEKQRSIPEEVLKYKNGPYKLESKNYFSKKKELFFENNIDYLLYELKKYALIINKLDTYGNAIPLGSFCFAISFILIGFLEAKVYKDTDYFFYIIIFILGGFGQLISGILEFIKGRTFPANLYLLYGIYFLCYYYINHINKNLISDDDNYIKSFYYGSWAILSLPLFIGSIKINLFYSIQTFIGFAFFVIRCVGEYKKKNKLNELVSGILELITGFISLYICFNQIINFSFRFQALPSIAFSNENDIDIPVPIINGK